MGGWMLGKGFNLGRRGEMSRKSEYQPKKFGRDLFSQALVCLFIGTVGKSAITTSSALHSEELKKGFPVKLYAYLFIKPPNFMK